MFHASILTIFPEMFPGPLRYSLAGQALTKGLWSYDLINIRNFGRTSHKNVDDIPYGGGHGLIMRPDVLGDALDFALKQHPKCPIYYPSPRGVLLTQSLARQIASMDKIVILCGRFEGIDERVIDEYNMIEISIGDYILSGGEVASLVMLDTVIRLLPGVLINENTLNEESFEVLSEFAGLLEPPLYTRPSVWRTRRVPEVLVSGNHKLIKKWKHEQSECITKIRRPDLLKTKDDHKV